MLPGQSLSQLTSKLLVKLENQFSKDKPDLILAHGDTTTCFATAVSAFYHQIPFFHVEAGLRTHRLNSPFPEEFNRQTIAPIARHHFAPTPLEKENLLKDGICSSAITITGSTVHEAVQAMKVKISPANELNFSALKESRPLVVVTLHRREAIGSLEETLIGIKNAASNRTDALFICPVHPSPSVQNAFRSILSGIENVILTEPLEYPQFISLLLRSTLVVTDSGGVQEEASFLGKNTLLARFETERTDGLQSGLTRLVGIQTDNIQHSILQGLLRPFEKTDSTDSSIQTKASEIIADKVFRMVR
jgi:UDP-N-acetylglucosamine 2-epimerase (non-hydrolysing)